MHSVKCTLLHCFTPFYTVLHPPPPPRQASLILLISKRDKTPPRGTRGGGVSGCFLGETTRNTCPCRARVSLIYTVLAETQSPRQGAASNSGPHGCLPGGKSRGRPRQHRASSMPGCGRYLASRNPESCGFCSQCFGTRALQALLPR